MNIVDLFYESADDDTDIILHEIESFPFLSPYKLIFIHYFLDTKRSGAGSDEEEEDRFKRIEKACAEAPATSIIVFVSPSPDKRRGLYKRIPNTNIKHFKVDKYLTIHGFNEHKNGISVADFFLSRTHANISRDVMNYLIHALSSDRTDDNIDLFLLHHELEKLESYTQGRTVTREDVDAVVTKMFGEKIFVFTDALGKKKAKEAIDIMDNLLREGEEIYSFWGLMMAHFRRLLIVKTMLDEQKPLAQIRSFLGAVAFKTDDIIQQTRHFTLAQLQTIYRMLLDIDIKQKTGAITITTTDVTAFQLAIEKFILLVSLEKN
jgi:DNA polymerase-3 subunit delta